jgi:hypothetical protein
MVHHWRHLLIIEHSLLMALAVFDTRYENPELSCTKYGVLVYAAILTVNVSQRPMVG